MNPHKFTASVLTSVVTGFTFVIISNKITENKNSLDIRNANIRRQNTIASSKSTGIPVPFTHESSGDNYDDVKILFDN